jgi:hypothetical protein
LKRGGAWFLGGKIIRHLFKWETTKQAIKRRKNLKKENTQPSYEDGQS